MSINATVYERSLHLSEPLSVQKILIEQGLLLPDGQVVQPSRLLNDDGSPMSQTQVAAERARLIVKSQRGEATLADAHRLHVAGAALLELTAQRFDTDTMAIGGSPNP